VTTPDNRVDNQPDDQTDGEGIDAEAIGRLLLERQSPTEREQAQEIFRQLTAGTSIGRLRDQIHELAQTIAQQATRGRRDTRWR
jgi:hypothetical protein